MCPLVFNQARALTEALPTFLTFIGFLSSVESVMLQEVRLLFETLLTVIIFIRSFSMELPLGLKRPEVWKFPTLSTDLWGFTT